MLPEVETASDVLSVADTKDFMIAVLVFGNEFSIVEQGKKVAARLKIGLEIKETSCLADSLGVVCQRITQAERQMTCVLGLLPLTGLRIKVFLENWVDIGNLYAVEINRRKVMCCPIVVFPVITERSSCDIARIIVSDLRIEAQRNSGGRLVIS